MPAKETRRIVAEGNLIRVERNIIEREVRLDSFIESLNAMEPVTTGVLPANCCYYGQARIRQDHNARLYVILLPDHVQPMLYKPYRLERLSQSERQRVYQLDVSWPPTLWFFSFFDRSLSSVRARTFTGDLGEQGNDTPVYNTHLPNFHGEGETDMCVGSIGVNMSLPFAKRLGLIMREILGSTWNDDLTTRFENTGVTDLIDWSDKSKADASFWEKMTFKRFTRSNVPETFGSLCAQILR